MNRLGDVLVFRRQDGFIVHRLIGRAAGCGRRFLIKGDCCFAPDPPVTGGEILGRAVGIEVDGAVRVPRSWRRPWSVAAAVTSRFATELRRHPGAARAEAAVRNWMRWFLRRAQPHEEENSR